MRMKQIDLFKEQPDFKGDHEHFAILLNAIEKGDIALWNKWRELNKGIVPELIGAYLNETDLNGANFSHTNFDKATFHKASIKQANMDNANLNCTDLSQADFLQASFNNAYIYGANLIHSDLSEANLQDANLSTSLLMGTTLSKVVLTGAIVFETDFINGKLEEATCEYVYLDQQRKKRFPQNRDFKEGELEKILTEHRTINEEISLD